jgi:hypothetical protein
MTENQIIEKLTKKDLLAYMQLNEEQKKIFLDSKKEAIEKRESKKDRMKSLLESIRIEKNDIGIYIEVPVNLLESDKKESYTHILDFSQYSQFGKSTVKIKGTDGKEYGLLLTVLEYP